MHVLDEKAGAMSIVSGQLDEETMFIKDEKYMRRMRMNLSIYYTITVYLQE